MPEEDGAELSEILNSPALQCLVQAIPAPLYITDTQGRIQLFNEAAVKLWGQPPGPDHRWTGPWTILGEDGNVIPENQCATAQTLLTGCAVPPRIMTVERGDGQRLHVAPQPRPLLDDKGRLIGAVNLLLTIPQLDTHLGRQVQISRLLSEGTSLKEVAPGVLALVRDLTRSQVVTLWVANGRASMTAAASVHAPEPQFAAFAEVCLALAPRFNENMPGRVLMERQPVWFEDIYVHPRLRRAEAARTAELQSAALYPVMTREDLPARAVLEVMFSEHRVQEDATLRQLEETAHKLGLFIDRMDIEQAAAQDERRLTSSN
jgi:hypothetical protein